MISSILTLLLGACACQPVPAATPPDARAVAIEPDARYWRGNLHTHTFWSDGNDFPEMVAAWYASHAYNFLAISDHNVLQQGLKFKSLKDIDQRSRGKAFDKYLARYGPEWVETKGSKGDGTLEVRLKPFDEYRSLFERAGQFIMLPAEEISAEAANKRTIHINATNLLEFIAPAKGETVVEVIAKTTAAARAQAARTGRQVLIHVNHPNFRWGVTAEDLAAITGDRFFEVWNGHSGVNGQGEPPRPSTDEIWDIASTLRMAGFGMPPLLGLATDDSHDYHDDTIGSMPGRGWVMVRAKRLTPESLIKALHQGDFYSSSGVMLDEVVFDAATGRLSLRVATCGDEKFTTRFIGTRKVANLKGTPRKDKDGKVVETTLDYTLAGTPPIGEVLASVEGLTPSYTLKGDELYVRAVVTSTGIPDFPTPINKLKRAWTQPVGWEKSIAPPPVAAPDAKP
ncbi:MAG: hypothetical protein AABZ53_02920 [Planctomycetota bacterium]